jgi:hypothetical protein
VPTTRYYAATQDLLAFFNFSISKSWLVTPTGQSDNTIGELDYGVELVTTSNSQRKFLFDDFEVIDVRN